jgi:hypothetical protein
MRPIRQVFLNGGLLVLVALATGGCGQQSPVDGSPLTPPASVTMADVVGDYDLVAIRCCPGVPEQPLPAWTFPGRVLVLEGHLHLRADSIAVSSGRSRLTLFNDTTYSSGTDSVRWTVRSDGVIDFVSGRQFPEDQGRATPPTGVLVVGGGLTSGGTNLRYQRR